MQTFLPYPNFVESAKCLDRARLGKQRVEVLGLLKGIVDGSGGWNNHPASKMWRGHEGALCIYGLEMCKEWVRRGYKDNVCYDRICSYISYFSGSDELANPLWMGDNRLHSSHRSNLLRKDPIFYGKFGWTEDPTLAYWWPK